MNSIAPTPRATAKRNAIHAAAQGLFLQHGFAGTSMDAIALAANVSKQTLYRYYQNKEALFVAVLEQLALDHLAEPALIAARDMPMDSQATLEHALTLWAQMLSSSRPHPSSSRLLYSWRLMASPNQVPVTGDCIMNHLLHRPEQPTL